MCVCAFVISCRCSYDIIWCEVLAEKVATFMDQQGKSRPLLVFYKGGAEITRITEANGEHPHLSPLTSRSERRPLALSLRRK